MQHLLAEGVARGDFAGKRIVIVVPDTTRTAPVRELVNTVVEQLRHSAKAIDILIALGTHQPLDGRAVRKHLDSRLESGDAVLDVVRVFNHEWDNPAMLADLGWLTADKVADISRGMMREDVPISINRRVFDYDKILVLSPVFPHEIVGMSGGSKYFFPGISGPQVIDATHWLGALIGNLRIIGRVDTPVRRMIDTAADLLDMDVFAVCFVVQGEDVVGLFTGELRRSWRRAAELAQERHIVRKARRFRQVLARAPKMYEDLWTGGKCMYKCESIVADGGELIIYAPHITSLSYTHGHLLERVGYHVVDYFCANRKRYRDVPRAVMAAAAYIRGSGTYQDGKEQPRIDVTLATQIPEELCKRVGLGYRDPRSIDIDRWADSDDGECFYVERAGETLYLFNEH